MAKFITFEHHRTGYEPEVMSEAEFHAGGRALIEEADAFVWQEADTAEQALAQHNDKHDEWAADVRAGREERQVY